MCPNVTSAEFQDNCRLASKKVPKVPVFFGLEGTLFVAQTHKQITSRHFSC